MCWILFTIINFILANDEVNLQDKDNDVLAIVAVEEAEDYVDFEDLY